MGPNPILRRLGLGDHERVAIIHTDDIGMCQASVEAFARLWDFGVISSGAVMVPCPWFLEAAEYSRAHPEADLGIHVTLTSEYPTYRWGPISTRDPRSGLLDEEGYFYAASGAAQEHGDPIFVQREIEAQVERAIAAGMQPTHMDTHMGTVASPKFIPAYLQTALKFRLPPMILRTDAAGWMAVGLDAQMAEIAAVVTQQMEQIGLPLIDQLGTLNLENPDDRLEYAKRTLGELKPGLTHFIIHPALDTPELRAIADTWRARAGDYETFMREDIREVIRAQGIHVVGYRQLQQMMPDPSALAAIGL